MTKDAGGPPADLQASRLRSDFGSREGYAFIKVAVPTNILPGEKAELVAVTEE